MQAGGMDSKDLAASVAVGAGLRTMLQGEHSTNTTLVFMHAFYA